MFGFKTVSFEVPVRYRNGNRLIYKFGVQEKSELEI